MRRRRHPSTPAPYFAAAAAAYGLNVALGTGVAAGVIRTGRFRWIHHACYVVTCAAVALALGTGSVGRRRNLRAVAALAPAAVPLTAIAYAGTRGLRHPLIALAAAPFLVMGLLVSLPAHSRRNERK